MDKFVLRLKKDAPEPEMIPSTSNTKSPSPKNRLNNTNNSIGNDIVEVESAHDGTDSGSDDGSKENARPKKRKKYVLKPQRVITLHTNYPWLAKNTTHLHCKLCNSKISGGKYHLKRHEVTELHQRMFNAASKSVQITKLLPFEKTDTKYGLIKEAELRLCCYICEHNLSLLTLDTLPLFNKQIYSDSEIAKGVVLKRKKATKLIVEVLAPYFKKEIVEDLKKTRMSIIVDETTDISTTKSLAVLVRYFKNGYVHDRFLDLITVMDGTAASLFQSIKNLLDENKIPYNNIIGFGADNVNTMMGDIKGVQRKLKEIAPHIYVQGCSCHSLHLCAFAAAQKLPGTVEQLARDIYSYFAHSSKRIEALKGFQKFVDEKPHKLLRPSQTRWLSLQASVDRILVHWNSLKLFFQSEALEENLPAARSIFNALQGDEFKIYFLFLSYVLELINKLNIELQSEKPKIPVLLNRLTALYKTLLKGFIRKDILDKVPIDEINVKNPHNYIKIENLYVGAKADALMKSRIDVPELFQNFRLRALNFYIEFCSQLRSRFNFNDPHLKFAANFTPEIALKGEINSISEFINFFPNIEIYIEAANIEWQLLSGINIPQCTPNMDISDFWCNIANMTNSLGGHMFQNLMIIVSTILTLPHSSAAAERIFSELNNTKTAIRNRLLIKTCSAILRVKDKMKMVPGGSLEWRPNKILQNYTPSFLETINSEELSD